MKEGIFNLSIQNPWWEKESLEYDPVLEEYDSQQIPFQWNVLQERELERDGVYLIQGPRGMGKTTLLKRWIRFLLEKRNLDPSRIFYYACFDLSGLEELNEILKVYIDLQRSKNKEQRLYIFLDEVTMVKDWKEGLRYLRSSGILKNVTLICSGSLKTSPSEDVQIKELLPLSFEQFLSLSRPGISTERNNSKSLEYYLDAYLLTGGFPSAINDFYLNNTVKQKVYDDFLYWLIADIAFTGRDMFLVRQIISNVISHAGRPVGFKTLARNTKAKTHITVQDYIGILERMFGIDILYQSSDGKEANTARSKKLYFTDPFLFWLFYCYIHNSLHYWRFARQSLHRYDVFRYLVEQVVYNHLNKLKSSPSVFFQRDIYKKEEIDFLVVTRKRAVPVMLAGGEQEIKKKKDILKRQGFPRGVIIGNGDYPPEKGIKVVTLLDFLMDTESFLFRE